MFMAKFLLSVLLASNLMLFEMLANFCKIQILWCYEITKQ